MPHLDAASAYDMIIMVRLFLVIAFVQKGIACIGDHGVFVGRASDGGGKAVGEVAGA